MHVGHPAMLIVLKVVKWKEPLSYTKIHQRKYTSSYATGHMWGNNKKVFNIIYSFLIYLDLRRKKIKHFSEIINEKNNPLINYNSLRFFSLPE